MRILKPPAASGQTVKSQAQQLIGRETKLPLEAERAALTDVNQSPLPPGEKKDPGMGTLGGWMSLKSLNSKFP